MNDIKDRGSYNQSASISRMPVIKATV